jgi:hypothetical protein
VRRNPSVRIFEPSPEFEHAVALPLDFPSSKTEQNYFVLFINHPVCGIFVIAI